MKLLIIILPLQCLIGTLIKTIGLWVLGRCDSHVHTKLLLQFLIKLCIIMIVIASYNLMHNIFEINLLLMDCCCSTNQQNLVFYYITIIIIICSFNHSVILGWKTITLVNYSSFLSF